MKASLNIIEKLSGLNLPPVDELVKKVNAQLGGVEEIINIGEKYADAKIVRVVECEKHPDADKLSVCKIDVGESELVRVVCGAPNAHADMWAVWLPPESTVPSTYGTDEPFVLGARALRGVMSNGMLAAGDELAINNDHQGIIEITDYDLPEGVELTPGMSFAKTFGLEGHVIDIENKMFTHRPDLFGQIGVAREIFAISQTLPSDKEFSEVKFKNEDWYWKRPEFVEADGLNLEVFNEALEKSPRFMAVAMDDVEVTLSPLWLQCALVALGSKPINNIVDITNYLMLMTAQPIHAYDHDKLRGNKLGVRLAKKGEKLKLINNKTYELSEDDLVIVDGEGPVGLAGVMGGMDSEVTESTTRIVLEVANFNMYSVRKTSMRHGLFTDAVTRFNKGQSPLQTDRVMRRLLEMISGNQASPVFDIHDNPAGLEEVAVHPAVTVTSSFINERLGLHLSAMRIGNLLRFANFSNYPSEDNPEELVITAPFWRTDIEQPEDIVEEVGRLYGFDKLPNELPTRNARPVPKSEVREIKRLIRNSLAKSGANEVMTYSFVHEDVLKKSEQDVAQAFKLSNALSPDLQYYRLTVLPSLLDKVNMNVRAGHDEFTLFEIGKGHNKKYHLDDDEGLPSSSNFVDAVYTSKKPKNGAPFFRIRRQLVQLSADLGIQLVFKSISEAMDYPVTAPFDLSRSALVETKEGTFIGMVGELKQAVRRSFKLPDYTAAMTLDTMGIMNAYRANRKGYRPLSRYPSTTQDVSFKMDKDISYATLLSAVELATGKTDDSLEVDLQPVAVYQADDDHLTKTITLRFKFTNHDKTLTDKETAALVQKITKRAVDAVGAEIV